MSPLTFDELTLLRKLMLDMQSAAINADWPELNRLDGERRDLLQFTVGGSRSTIPSNLQSISVDSDQADVAVNVEKGSAKARAELEKQILELDRLVIETVQNARQQLLANNRELSARKKAKSQYAMTSLYC